VNDSAKKYSVLMVGCGNIAGGFDAARADDAPPLTHAGAYRRHGGFELAACVDPDFDRRNAFQARWEVGEALAAIPGPEEAGRFEVVSICSPTALHETHMEAALALEPRLIFCEKPLADTLDGARKGVHLCREEAVLLAVNHTRRWAPDVLRLRAELTNGEWGEVRSVVGHYNKGILNNGRHMIDLLQYLFGSVELASVGEARDDHADGDPTVAACLRLGGGVTAYLNPGHAADFSLFELHIITSKGFIEMENGGMSWRFRRCSPSPNFPGIQTLEDSQSVPGEYSAAMLRCVQNLHDALRQGAPLACTGEGALAVHEVCHRINMTAASQPALESGEPIEH